MQSATIEIQAGRESVAVFSPERALRNPIFRVLGAPAGVAIVEIVMGGFNQLAVEAVPAAVFELAQRNMWLPHLLPGDQMRIRFETESPCAVTVELADQAEAEQLGWFVHVPAGEFWGRSKSN